ncbi:MAG: 50S ribosomal protein L11 methyltransferase [Pseudomonadales bacterium]
MPWIQLQFEIEPAQSEALEDAMLLLGCSAVTFEDRADQAIYEPLPGTTPLWSETRLTGLFDAETDMQSLLVQLDGLCGPLPRHRVEILEDKDWEREWMIDYHAMCFGQRLWICPSWQEPPEPTAVNLMLDPGLAFGSGTHPTTGLCMEWLDANNCTDKHIIDYGCGSGVLAVAALLLGARQAIGVDIDPQALIATQENARRNGIQSERLHTYVPDQFATDVEADIVLANILAGPLIELSSIISQLVKPGGQLVLSGILPQQAEQVAAAYAPWIQLAPATERDGWVRLDGTRR